jgi:transposase-like protein
MIRKARTTFSAEFKREAVRLLKQGHKEASQLAREFGLRRNQAKAHDWGRVLNFMYL